MVSNSLHWTALARTHLHVPPSFPEHALYVVGAKLIINSIFINIITVNWDCIFYILYELKTVEFWLATHLHRKHRHRKSVEYPGLVSVQTQSVWQLYPCIKENRNLPILALHLLIVLTSHCSSSGPQTQLELLVERGDPPLLQELYQNYCLPEIHSSFYDDQDFVTG